MLEISTMGTQTYSSNSEPKPPVRPGFGMPAIVAICTATFFGGAMAINYGFEYFFKKPISGTRVPLFMRGAVGNDIKSLTIGLEPIGDEKKSAALKELLENAKGKITDSVNIDYANLDILGSFVGSLKVTSGSTVYGYNGNYYSGIATVVQNPENAVALIGQDISYIAQNPPSGYVFGEQITLQGTDQPGVYRFEIPILNNKIKDPRSVRDMTTGLLKTNIARANTQAKYLGAPPDETWKFIAQGTKYQPLMASAPVGLSAFVALMGTTMLAHYLASRRGR